MDNRNREPQFEGLYDFDTFFWLLEDSFGLSAIEIVAREIDLANSKAREVVDLRKRDDGRFNLYCKADKNAAVVIVLERGPNGRLFGVEGGFLKV